MAQFGLNFGERVELCDGLYQVMNDKEIINLKDLLSGYSFIEATQIWGTMTDPNNPRNTIRTGELVGVRLALRKAGAEALFVDLYGVTEVADFLSKGIKFRQEVELIDSLVSPISFEDNQVKFFARDVVAKQAGQVHKGKENKQENQG